MQDENQKPDYSFIMNQPGFEPTPPKRRPKGIMFVVAGVALVGVLAVVGILAQRSTNVKQVATPEQLAQQTVSQYLNNLGSAKYAEAYDMVTPADSSKVVPRETFVSTLGPLLGNMYDYSTCKITSTKTAGSKFIINVLCNYKDSPLQENLAVTTATNSQNTVKIVEVTNTDREQA